MDNAPTDDVSALRLRVSELEAAVRAMQNTRRTDNERLVDLLRRQSTVAGSLERRLNILSAAVSLCTDQIIEIKRSRTWQTLIWLGGKVLRLKQALRGNTSSRGPARNFVVASAKEMYWCDEPLDRVLVSAPILIVRGWCFGKEPVTRVLVKLGSRMTEARLGTPRPDIAKAYPALPAAERSGYEATIDASRLEEGVHDLLIEFYTGSRCAQTLRPRLVVTGARTALDPGPTWLTKSNDTDLVALSVSSNPVQPLVSILMPVFNPAPEILSCAVQSAVRQVYPKWEICLVDDSSDQRTQDLVAALAATDTRILVRRNVHRLGIAATSNRCLEMASGDIVVLLDQDDELCPDALLRVVERVQRNPSFALIYSDEDKLSEDGRAFDPFFKPDWSPDLIRSMNYVGHLVAIPRTLLVRMGGFRSEYEGSQDLDVVLRAAESGLPILHIDRVLYHWRAIPGSVAMDPSAKPFAHQSAARALADHLIRSGEPGIVEATSPGRFHVSYTSVNQPPVSIIIAAGGRVPVLRQCLNSIRTKTTYPQYDVLVVDNSRHSKVEELLAGTAYADDSRLRYLDWRSRAFNYSAINNVGAKASSSPLILFLNDDTEVISTDWLDALVQHGVRKCVGAVGAKLLYPDGRLQHAGVSLGVFDCCANSFQGVPPHATYFDLADVTRNVLAVTGACLLTRRDVFASIGGFDEDRFPVAFNDVDLCLEIGSAGYRVIYTPRAVLYHHEAHSKSWDQLTPTRSEVRHFREKWQALIDRDPFYNSQLTRDRTDFSYA